MIPFNLGTSHAATVMPVTHREIGGAASLLGVTIGSAQEVEPPVDIPLLWGNQEKGSQERDPGLILEDQTWLSVPTPFVRKASHC